MDKRTGFMPSSIEKLSVKLVQFLKDNEMVLPGEKILLAVSGGMDSALMTELFNQTAFDFGIAHCNFSLRANESDEEELFVKNMADRFKKTFHGKRFDTSGYAATNKCSIQEAARELRYNWFNELSNEYNYHKIATAHHLDDSIETFFINLLRGTGPAGLRGIPFMNGKIIRPMLFLTRTEIEQTAKEYSLLYKTDSSNQKDDYLRNRIRHHLIPVMKENAPAFDSTMQKLMHEMSFVHSFTMNRMEEWKKKYVKEEAPSTLLIPIRALLKEEDPAYFLSTLLYTFGIKGADCRSILRTETPGKIFFFGEKEILRDRLNLIVRSNGEEEVSAYTLHELPAKIISGNKQISIQREDPERITSGVERREVQFVDGDDFTFPLTLRPWQAGDYFFPLGMKGKKKISDFYTDIKLNRFEKDKTLILLSGKNIVCILGHRIDERYKIKAGTKNIFAIEVTTR